MGVKRIEGVSTALDTNGSGSEWSRSKTVLAGGLTMGVTGIGGLFFRARDPAALSEWYRETLGIGDGAGIWAQEAGTTVFAPFAEDSDYFAADRRWMLNLRVTDLDGLLATLAAAGIAIETRAEWDESGYGRFARIHDPEGNPIELWQPAE